MSDFEQIKTELADSAARSDIECLLERKGEFSDAWYDTRTCDEGFEDDLMRALQYLTHREMIEKHPEHKYWVRIR